MKRTALVERTMTQIIEIEVGEEGEEVWSEEDIIYNARHSSLFPKEEYWDWDGYVVTRGENK